MFEVLGHNGLLFQWDLNRFLRVAEPPGCTISKVDFCNRMCINSLRVAVDRTGEDLRVKIPDILLQTEGNINVYAVCANNNGIETIVKGVLSVNRKKMPEDYVYTEDDVKTWEALEHRVEAIEKNGCLTITDDGNGNVIIEQGVNEHE